MNNQEKRKTSKVQTAIAAALVLIVTAMLVGLYVGRYQGREEVLRQLSPADASAALAKLYAPPPRIGLVDLERR